MAEIIRSRQAPGVIIRGSSHVDPGNTWKSGDMWGRVFDREHPQIAETRQKLEAGAYKRGAERTNALTYLRSYELAVAGSLDKDGIVGNLKRLNDNHDKYLSKGMTPLKHGLVSRTLAKRTRKRKGGPGTVVESRIRIDR